MDMEFEADKKENKDEAQEKDNKPKSSKKKNKRKKATNGVDGEKNLVSTINESEVQAGCNISIQDIRKAMEVFSLQQKPAKTPEEALQKPYQFWSTQPVPKMDEKITVNEPIEVDKKASEIRQEPYSLPAGFQWDTLTLDDPLVLKELYTLLNENYVEDDDSMFRFDYPPQFLKWALQPPGWRKEWHCGVRVTKSGRLVGFISAIPATLNIYKSAQKMVEINFLCVHKKLRLKRVAPVLIREITRRVNQTGIFQAVYTAGVVLPKPIGTCRSVSICVNLELVYYFICVSHMYGNPSISFFVVLLLQYLSRFDLVPLFSEEEFRHWFLPQAGIVDTFVVEKNGELTDMVSFYTLPSTVMHHPVHRTLKAAYSFYNVSVGTQWVDLMGDALISAKNAGFDVFNALDLMENKEFLEPLKFGIGDGNLQYYLYNWRCPSIAPNKIGLVLQ
ncbi:glycylpeptide N-tetradecanoyltransferase 1 [Nilaparvata lugens]|uniref:glycylpeptide N-tetradecanoyltransferase 1 n=1 Tax=Nilaparvata lugens TaxID=108931 RepID=UPI00193EC09B|nr:glycylpeptide N-tetradecanoyltransferase 1 [Nilaparvata lugens]